MLFAFKHITTQTFFLFVLLKLFVCVDIELWDCYKKFIFVIFLSQCVNWNRRGFTVEVHIRTSNLAAAAIVCILLAFVIFLPYRFTCASLMGMFQFFILHSVGLKFDTS